MVKIISEQPKKKIGKRIVLVVVILIILIGLGVAGWFLKPHTSTNSSDNGQVQGVPNVSSQPALVQQASQDAAKKASSGDTNGAIQTLGDAAQSANNQSDKADLYSQQAALYAQSGNNDGAVSAGKQAIAADPIDWKNYANLGYIYKSIGDKKNALDYFNQALSVMKQQGDTSSQSEIQGQISQLGAS